MIQSCIVSRKVGQSRIYALYMTVYLVIFLPEIRYLHCIYIWFWPTQIIRYAYHSYLSTFIQTLLLVFNHTPTCVHSHSYLCTFALLLVFIRTPTCVHSYKILSSSKFKHTGVGAFPDQHALRVMRTNPCIYHVLSQHCHILVRCTRELCWPKH